MAHDKPTPKPGETFRCEACGRDSIAKAQKIMDGWRCLGESVVCAFCKAPVAPPVPAGDAAAKPAADTTAARDRLASFLGTAPVAAPEFRDKRKGHFCKDCKHYFKHPFYSRCLLHEKPVEPMDDCADFTPRPPDSGEAPTGSSSGPQPPRR